MSIIVSREKEQVNEWKWLTPKAYSALSTTGLKKLVFEDFFAMPLTPFQGVLFPGKMVIFVC